MKRLAQRLTFLSLLLLGGCMTIAQSMVGGPFTDAERATPLRSRYDEFDNRTRVATWLTMTVGSSQAPPMEVMALFAHPDSVLREPVETVLFVFKTSGSTRYRDWTFLRSHDLALILDDTARIQLPGVRDGSVNTTTISEAVVVRIPPADLQRIAAASRVRGRIGPVEFDIDERGLVPLRALRAYARMEPGAVGPVPARECALCPKF